MYHVIHPFKRYKSGVFSLVAEVCHHHHNTFENIFISLKRNPGLFTTLPNAPSTQPLTTTNLISFLYGFVYTEQFI